MGQRIIGLTGGIATGKSTVSRYLAEQGLPILDADVYAREAVAVGSPILARIVERYGSSVQNPNGSLNRPQLGAIVFKDSQEKSWLEQQIHPFVRQRFKDVAQTYGETETLVYDIPLLFESQLTHLVTEIWVVICTPEQQLQRLMTRNQLGHDQAQSRIQSQLPLDQKASQADIILNNTQSRENLFQQIDQYLGKI